MVSKFRLSICKALGHDWSGWSDTILNMGWYKQKQERSICNRCHLHRFRFQYTKEITHIGYSWNNILFDIRDFKNEVYL